MPYGPKNNIDIVCPRAEHTLPPRDMTVAIRGLFDGPTILGKTAIVAVGVWDKLEPGFESDDPLRLRNCHL